MAMKNLLWGGWEFCSYGGAWGCCLPFNNRLYVRVPFSSVVLNIIGYLLYKFWLFTLCFLIFFSFAKNKLITSNVQWNNGVLVHCLSSLSFQSIVQFPLQCDNSRCFCVPRLQIRGQRYICVILDLWRGVGRNRCEADYIINCAFTAFIFIYFWKNNFISLLNVLNKNLVMLLATNCKSWPVGEEKYYCIFLLGQHHYPFSVMTLVTNCSHYMYQHWKSKEFMPEMVAL